MAYGNRQRSVMGNKPRQRPGPKPAQHPDEVLVDALKEQYKRDVELLVEFLTTNGRPIFSVQLTPDEELARFRDPLIQPLLLKDIETRQGPAAVGRYIQHIYTLMGNQEKRDLAKWQPNTLPPTEQ